VNSVNSVSFGVPGPSGYTAQPAQKRRRTDEPRKPALDVANIPLYKKGRNYMVKRIKWEAIVAQLKQYKDLKAVPFYCKIVKQVPQVLQSDPTLCTWWENKISTTQKELFSYVQDKAEEKTSLYLASELEATSSQIQ
jgi:hypothetical protein